MLLKGVIRLFLGVLAFFFFLGCLVFGAVYFKAAQEGPAPWELAAASAGNLAFAGLLLALRRRIGSAEGAADAGWHKASPEDLAFAQQFEACKVAPEAFDQAAHVRLAYIYLCEAPAWAATDRMKKSLLGFLAHLRVTPTRYHDTIARAWILAVANFMDRMHGGQPCDSAATFIARNPRLLDSKIMLKYYSADVLLAPQARQEVVQPDTSPILPGAQSVPHKYRCEKCGGEKRGVILFRRHSWLLSVAGFVLAGVAYGPLKGPYSPLLQLGAFLLILSPIFLAMRLRCLKCEPVTWARQ